MFCKTIFFIFNYLLIIEITYIICELDIDNEIFVNETISKKVTSDTKKKEDDNGAIQDDVNIESEEMIENDAVDFDSMVLSDIFKHSVDAYLDNNWQECIDGFELVIQRSVEK